MQYIHFALKLGFTVIIFFSFLSFRLQHFQPIALENINNNFSKLPVLALLVDALK